MENSAYKVSEKQQRNIDQIKKVNSIIDFKIKRAISLLLDGNMALYDIAKSLDLSKETLVRYLNNYAFYEYIFEDQAEETYQKVTTKLSKMETHNLSFALPRLRIDIFSKDPNVQNEYLKLIALTFRIKTDLVSQMFGYPADYVFSKAALSKNTFVIHALEYLNGEDTTNQKEAISNLIKFYNSYVEAYADALKNKDNDDLKKKALERVRLLKRELNDFEAYELMKKKRNSGDKISEKDIAIMINYRIKYCLTNLQVAELFKVDRFHMVVRMYEYLEDKEDLKKQYMAISDRYSEDYLNTGGRR